MALVSFKVLFLQYVFFCLGFYCATLWAGQPGEIRGLWVVRTSLTSPESIDRLINEAADTGFNTLIVQVRGRGDAFYQSRLEPRSNLLSTQSAGFDPLAYLLEKAKPRDLRVHAWVNVLFVHEAAARKIRPNHVLARHSQWAMVPSSLASTFYSAKPTFPRSLERIAEVIRKNSGVEGFYLDPAEPGVREHLVAVCSDLLSRYAVDGLHLDYLRYPDPSFGYGRAALDSFRQEIDEKLKPAERQRMARAFTRNRLYYTQRYPRQWAEFRRRQVTDLAAALYRAAHGQRAGTMVTAAVKADSEIAYSQKFQDWKLWMEEGLLDGLCPMAYTRSNDAFKSQVAIARGLSFGRPVWVGIGAWQMSIQSTLEKIAITRNLGADGFLLFSYENLGNRTASRSAPPLPRLKAFLADSSNQSDQDEGEKESALKD